MSSRIQAQEAAFIIQSSQCATRALALVEWLKCEFPDEKDLQIAVMHTTLLAISSSEGMKILTEALEKVSNQRLGPGAIKVILELLPISNTSAQYTTHPSSIPSSGTVSTARKVDATVSITRVGHNRVLSATGKDNDHYGANFMLDGTKNLEGNYAVRVLEFGGEDTINTHSARLYGATVGPGPH